MNIVDGFILIPLVYYAFRGFKNGFIREAFSIVGLVIAVFFAFSFMGPVSEAASKAWDINFEHLPYIAFAVLFLILLIAFNLVITFTEHLLKALYLSMPNRVLGLVLATIKCALLISVAILFLSGFEIPGDETQAESLTYPFFAEVAPVVYDSIAAIYPGAESFAETVQQTIDKYNPISVQ